MDGILLEAHSGRKRTDIRRCCGAPPWQCSQTTGGMSECLW
jgi:hypothetical protein